MPDFLIRPETDRDREGIAGLLLAAFPTSSEARLVEQLRKDGDVVYSLVAVEASDVIGHALFSRLRAPDTALSLAPVAVAANRRRRGIAAALNRGWTRTGKGGVLGGSRRTRGSGLLPALRFQPGGCAGHVMPICRAGSDGLRPLRRRPGRTAYRTRVRLLIDPGFELRNHP